MCIPVMLQNGLADASPLFFNCNIKKIPTILVELIQICSTIHQESYPSRTTLACCHHQRSIARIVLKVNIGITLQQHLQYCCIALRCRVMQRRPALIVHAVDVCLVLYQCFTNKSAIVRFNVRPKISPMHLGYIDF